MQMATGLGGFALANWPGAAGSYPGTEGTNGWASPQGPQTPVEAGFGTSSTVAGGSGGKVSPETFGVIGAGTFAFLALIFVWWSLPR
jgi:hypothetical protein